MLIVALVPRSVAARPGSVKLCHVAKTLWVDVTAGKQTLNVILILNVLQLNAAIFLIQ